MGLIINSFDRFDIVNNPGDDKPAFTIWFAGCTVRCNGCHNTRLWDKNNGTKYAVDDVIDIIESQPVDYNSVILLGGEPLEQDINELVSLCRILDDMGYSTWLYTSYELDDIPHNILDNINMVKTGKFDINSITDGGLLASSNQKLFEIQHNGGMYNEDQYVTKTRVRRII